MPGVQYHRCSKMGKVTTTHSPKWRELRMRFRGSWQNEAPRFADLRLRFVGIYLYHGGSKQTVGREGTTRSSASSRAAGRSTRYATG